MIQIHQADPNHPEGLRGKTPEAVRMFYSPKLPQVLFLLLLGLYLSGCGSNNDGFVAGNPSGGVAIQVPDSMEENLYTLSQDISVAGLSTLARDGVRAKQIEEVVNGAKGGTFTITGDLNFGPNESNPAISTLSGQFNNYTFFDGLTLNGGTVAVATELWGSEGSAQGTVVIEAQGVTFSGSSSGVHSFKVEFDLVNSQVVDTVLTLDGREQVLGFVLNLANKSQSEPDQVFITILGKDAANTKWHYMADPDDEQLTEFEDQPGEFLNKVNGAFEGGEKYSMTLGDMTPVSEDTYRLIVPRENLVSGRIYFAFGQKLQGIGINAPYYNRAGRPITAQANGTGTLVSGNTEVTISGIDATESIGLNEPVTYQAGGNQVQATVVDIVSSNTIKIAPAPTVNLPSVALQFTPDPEAIEAARLNLSGPSPTGPPDYLKTFDLMELSATTNPDAEDPFYTLFANTTAIDFFSVGIGMTVNFSGLPPSGNEQGTGPVSHTVGFGQSAEQILAGDTQRDAIIDRFNNTSQANPATPSAFQAFVTASPNPTAPVPGPDSTGDPHITFGKPVNRNLQVIRVLGPPPIVALLPNGSLSQYLEPAISAEWQPYASQGEDIAFPDEQSPAFLYKGTAGSGETLNLTCTLAAGANTGQGESYALPAPTTRIVWECDDTDNPGPLPNNYQNAGTDAHRRLASIISAAFARGVFAGGVDAWADSSQFYSRADLRYNFFSKVMHDFALDGIVYGFAYDDVFGQDSTLAGPIGLTNDGKVPQSEEGNVVNVVLTIPNFTAPPPPARPGVPLTVQAVQNCPEAAVSFDGCVAHLTPATGPDIAVPLDASGRAVITGLSSNVTYTAWIAPGPDWFISYAAVGKYDGTTNGDWNSSFGDSEAGVIKLQIGTLVPGVGSCLDPQPNPLEGVAPEPTSGSGQSGWGNL